MEDCQYTIADGDRLDATLLTLPQGLYPIVSANIQPTSTVMNNPADGTEMLRIAADGFYVRGARVEQDAEEAARVFDAFCAYMGAIGYRRSPRSSAMTFGEALEALKSGKKVARAGWNGKGMWLSLSGPLEGRTIPHSAFWSKNNADYAREQEGFCANVLPCITMKTADGSILMGWLASQSDMLADDWMIVE